MVVWPGLWPDLRAAQRPRRMRDRIVKRFSLGGCSSSDRQQSRRPSFASLQRDSFAYGPSAAGSQGLMSVPGVDQVAAVVAREQVDIARRELTARARQAGPGVAMVGGGSLLAALASGTGTAALILLLARRPGPSAAALGVTGAYAGAGAFLARKGLARLREAGPPLPDVPVQDEPVQNAKQELGSAKRRTKSAVKSPRRPKSPAKSPPQPTGRPKPKSKSPSSRARASRTQPDRSRRRAS
jgi:Putative Actinobacterial Holin-X, holin superfamily III